MIMENNKMNTIDQCRVNDNDLPEITSERIIIWMIILQLKQ